MKLNSIEVRGFRSFAAPQKLDIAAMQPGLYYLTGQNLVDPEMGANAVGKSSLFDAFYWACRGQTATGVRAVAVKNWAGTNPCGVVLDLFGPTGAFTLCRMQGPNLLVVEDEQGDRPVDQDTLDLMLGMPSQVLLHSMYFSQFSPTFVDLDPRDQTELFTQVLGLYVWEQASDEAKASADKIGLDVQRLEVSNAKIEGQLHELAAVDYSAEEAQWKREREAELIVRQDEYDGCLIIVAEEKKKIEAAQKGADEYQRLVREAQPEQKLADRYLQTAGDIQRQNETLAKDNYDTCPTCGANVDPSHVQTHINRNKQLHKAALDAMKEAIGRRDQFLKLAQPYAEATQILVAAERGHSKYQSEAESFKRRIAEIKAEKSPYAKLQEEADQRGESLIVALENGEQELATKQREFAAAQYWIKGFKELRLKAIQNSLSQLDVEVNSSLGLLGLPDWRVRFDIEKETKARTIKKNFSVMVEAPHVPGGSLPWEAWCGGEQQRLRLAITMGFSDLVSSRLQVKPNFEFWDEPSKWMAHLGINGMLEMLAQRAKQQQKVILIADHRTLEFGGFAGTINIVKGKDGSRIELKG